LWTIKSLYPDVFDNKTVQQLEQENKLRMPLSHPNIQSVVELIYPNGGVALVQEDFFSPLNERIDLQSLTVTNSLVGYWPLDNNLTDSTGANNGTSVGTATYTTGKKGNGLVLSGSNAVSIPVTGALQTSSAYTYSYWLNLNSAGSCNGVAGQNCWAGISSATLGTSPKIDIQFDQSGTNVIVQHDNGSSVSTGATLSNLATASINSSDMSLGCEVINLI